MLKVLIALLGMNLRSLHQRAGTISVIVVGIAGVVTVLISVFAMSDAFTRTVAEPGRQDRALVMRAGSDSEATSTLSRDEAQSILDMPGVKRTAAGLPLVSLEITTDVRLTQSGDNAASNVLLRGVGPQAQLLRPELRMTEGRMFSPGTRELIVGKSAQGRFQGLAVGQSVKLRNQSWTVTGVFESGGSVHESSLFADASMVSSFTGRGGYNSAMVLLEDANAYTGFAASVETSSRKQLQAVRESDYLAAQSETISKLIRTIGRLVAIVMAIGAIFAAINSMHAAVATRVREIATLRAMGFGPGVVLTSVAVESLFLSLLGGMLGVAIAWLLLNGAELSTIGNGVSQIIFSLQIDSSMAIKGIGWALVLGFLGGAPSALRAARLPVVESLRKS